METSDSLKMNEKNTLHEVMQKLNSKREKEELKNLWLNYHSFKETFYFLLIIWSRIQNDVHLIVEKDGLEAVYDRPRDEDEEDPGEPTDDEKKQIAEGHRHESIVHLDVEDWFIHSLILMDKFAKLARGVFFSIHGYEKKHMINRIPFRSFHTFKQYFHKNKSEFFDTEFSEIIDHYTDWFYIELKDIRDDLIQHETSFKIWGSSFHSKKSEIKFSFAKFKPFHKPRKLYALMERNKNRFPQIMKCYSILEILSIFDEHWSELNQEDRDLVTSIKQSHGSDMPDIIKLFSKMSIFFTQVNDYFVRKIENN
jgi:hypothetical protein